MAHPVQVFISYQAADKPIAREIATLLFADDVGVWFDEWSISVGDSIPAELQAGMNLCTHFVILWSRSAAKSVWVTKEIEMIFMKAITEQRPRLVPVLLDQTALPMLLSPVKYLRYERGSRELDRRNLVREITGREPRATITKAIVAKFHELVTAENKELLGLRACPRCGSENLQPGKDLEVDSDWSDGQAVFYPLWYRTVACESCGWSGSEFDLNPLPEFHT